ncbi:LysR family transcriptional regulator [Microbulbifer salipaludis]|uniref:LysR family transcriptional regulator n=1 Tax=Microbulbifer salipaludis TaxID=187980 RepID=A0ABS3E844_9GAMM|nr:LysR family transcriptional regulator [Microbulbifer salipaludis]MBN8431432.1 LysR family transcriptional regulator [Microbulbifer salipaludis]
MSRINYHHLYYFWRVACAENLTQVAKDIHLSQSAISAQLKQFQHNLGVDLFERQGRKLVLTGEGRKVLDYANQIFAKGEELEQLIAQGFAPTGQHVSIGVLNNLSRNFVESFILPLLEDAETTFSLHTSTMPNLLNGLENYQYNVILTNHNVEVGLQEPMWRSELLSRQAIAVVSSSKPPRRRSFPDSYRNAHWVLPSKNSEVRSAFTVLCAKHQYHPSIKAETDDMAMLRLLARDSGAYSVLPEVVVRDEIAQGTLHVHQSLPDAYEHFYAVTLASKAIPENVQNLIEKVRTQR